VPPLTARVTDLTGTLAPVERSALEEKLARFEAQKGAQVAVLLVPSTAPEPIEAYAIRVVDAWRLGRAGSDDGALLLVATDDRRVRIEVGRGLEGALTDLASKRIIEEAIVPRFRAGDFAGGVDAGVDRMLSVIEGEPLPPPEPRRRGPPAEWSPLLVIGIPLVSLGSRAWLGAAGPFLLAALLAAGAWLVTGQLALALALGFFTLLVGLLGAGGRRWSSGGRRRSRGGGWGGGWSGGGGGGFSGGGGGFGGGGASGSW
jgi:uncharacterized protein